MELCSSEALGTGSLASVPIVYVLPVLACVALGGQVAVLLPSVWCYPLPS